MRDDRIIGNIILEGAVTASDTVILQEKDHSSVRKRVIAEGTLQDCDVENRNKRIYARSDLAPEVNGARMQELIESGTFKGHAGHPLSDDLVVQQTIDPKLVCVKYLKVWMDKNKVKAWYKGTNNDYGQQFDDDLRDGEKPAFSLRALGSIQNVNGKAYVKNIKIITWDHVIYPSHKAAYTDRIVSESTGSRDIQIESQFVVPEDDPGRIITLRESDARTVINRIQRESANLSNIINALDGIYDKITLVRENTVQLTDCYGQNVYVNLENHIDNIIMDYVYKM